MLWNCNRACWRWWVNQVCRWPSLLLSECHCTRGYISESQIHQSIIYLILIKGSSVLVGQGIRKVSWNHLNLSSKQLTILVFFGQELWVFPSFCCLKSMQPVPMPVISHLEPSWTCGLLNQSLLPTHRSRSMSVVCWSHWSPLRSPRAKKNMRWSLFFWERVFGEGILFRLEGSWKFLNWKTPASLFHEVLPRDFFFEKESSRQLGPPKTQAFLAYATPQCAASMA